MRREDFMQDTLAYLVEGWQDDLGRGARPVAWKR